MKKFLVYLLVVPISIFAGNASKKITFESIIFSPICGDRYKTCLREGLSTLPEEKIKELTYEIKKNHGKKSVKFKKGEVSLPIEIVAAKNSSVDIKIGYFIWDTTSIPRKFIRYFEENFDAIAVPNPSLVSILKGRNIKIPVFVFPFPLKLNAFFNIPEKKNASKPFVFGTMGDFFEWKNFSLLVSAFHHEFKNSPDVKLELYLTGCGKDQDFMPLMCLVEELKNPNIKVHWIQPDEQARIKKFENIDCFVNLSKREGIAAESFEAMAAGIPCILSNHTAHGPLAASGFTKAISANVLEPAIPNFLNSPIGCQFNCRFSYVVSALKEVYERYDDYVQLAKKGKNWLQTNFYEQIQNCYANLFFPYIMKLDSENVISAKEVKIEDSSLYNKFLDHIKNAI